MLTRNCALTVYLYARLAQSIPVVVGKVYGHHVSKELYSVAYLTIKYSLDNAWMVSFYALSVHGWSVEGVH